MNTRHTTYGSNNAHSNTVLGSNTAVPVHNMQHSYNTQPSAVDGVLDGPYQPGLTNRMEAAPIESHALAQENQPAKGLVQQHTGNQIKDLGWNEPKELIPGPLVGGLQNEDLWILIRRFNKVCIPGYMQ